MQSVYNRNLAALTQRAEFQAKTMLGLQLGSSAFTHTESQDCRAAALLLVHFKTELLMNSKKIQVMSVAMKQDFIFQSMTL
jgi:hypothetical protein